MLFISSFVRSDYHLLASLSHSLFSYMVCSPSVTMTTPSPPHHLHHTISTTPAPPHHLHHTISTTPPPHHLHHTISTTPSPPHHLHHIISTTLSPPHHLHHTISGLIYQVFFYSYNSSLETFPLFHFLFFFRHCLPMVGLQPFSSLSTGCMMPLRGD